MKIKLTACLVLILAFMVGVLVAHGEVKYVSKDAKTLGNWKGKYGSSGGVIFDAGGVDAQNVAGKKGDQVIKGVLKEYDDQSVMRWNWASHTNEERGLQYVSDAKDRIGACIFGSGTVTITLTVDSKDYTVAAYFTDWDSSVRVQDISGYQGNKPPTKSDATLQGPEFHNGVWHLWTVTDSEPFKLQVTHKGGANWVISAFLIDVKAAVQQKNKFVATWGSIKNQ